MASHSSRNDSFGGLSFLASPSSFLPPARRIIDTPTSALQDALARLNAIYAPPVRGTRLLSRTRVHGPSLPTSTTLVRSSDEDEDALRADTFERSHSLRWLTTLSSLPSSDPDSTHGPDESILSSAAALLALCAGTAAAGAHTRTFTFDHGVRVDLKDAALDNGDWGTLGAQTWGGAQVLASALCESPSSFGLPLPLSHDSSADPLKVLELGAGTGLAGLTFSRLCSRLEQPAHVVLTDVHPAVLSNLSTNAEANPSSTASRVATTVEHLDWAEIANAELEAVYEHWGTFDVLLGADIVYELAHAAQLRECALRLLKKPSTWSKSLSLDTIEHDARTDPRFHLLVPFRATHAAEARAIEDVFSFQKSSPSSEVEAEADEGYASGAPSSAVSVVDDEDDAAALSVAGGSAAGMELVVLSKDVLECAAGEREVVEYAYYAIGWR